MEISAAALPFLILAAVLGPSTPAHDSGMEIRLLNHPFLDQGGVHRPPDCCFYYTPRNIRCVFMETYYETSSVCSQSAVIFKTKRGKEVCFHPGADGVQECMRKLA